MTPGKVENVFYIVRRLLNLVSDFPYSLSPSPCMVNSGPSVCTREGAEVFGLDCVRATAEEECSGDRERGSEEKKNYLKQLKQVKYILLHSCKFRFTGGAPLYNLLPLHRTVAA